MLGGEERSQAIELDRNDDLSIASNFHMNNAKINILRWRKVHDKLKVYEKNIYIYNFQTNKLTNPHVAHGLSYI